MNDARWMLYGATGYTGILVAEEAVRQGYRPLLAGRNEEKLRQLGRRLGLKYVAFGLDDVNTIAQHTATVDLVYHAAGPFVQTSDPMIRACLATHTHYVDITGEISVFENTFKYDDTARRNDICLMSGVGFDVIPSDCLALYVAQQVPNAQTLEIALQALGSISAGTAKSMLEMMPTGGVVRRSGALAPLAFGRGARIVQLNGEMHQAMPIPWGDLATAYRSTYIPNITTYLALPGAMITLAAITGSVGRVLLRSARLRRGVGALLDRWLTGPAQATLDVGKSYLWAQASDTVGNSAEAWLETPDGYRFTALAALPVIERVLSLRPIGALTPAQAFGADFVLEIAGVQRFDALP